MPTAIISQTVREPTTAEITQFIMSGDFTVGSGITVFVKLNLLNDSDGSINREMSFEFNALAGQKDHFQTDVVSALSGIIGEVETILGITFV